MYVLLWFMLLTHGYSRLHFWLQWWASSWQAEDFNVFIQDIVIAP